jgi:lipopolysaccharide export system permease protein
MKILHRFMLRQFVGPFIIVFIVAVFTLLMQFLWKYIDDLIGKGLNLSVIAELFLYTSANLSIMAFPLSVLIGSIFTLGNMGENYELIALKAAGISLQRIMLPLIILSCIITICAFIFANNVTPYTNWQMRALIYDIQQQRPELQIREGIFYNGIEGYSIRIGERNYKTNLLLDVRIYDHTENIGNKSVILADSGYMAVTADKRFLEVTLFSGHRYEDMYDKKTVGKKNKTFSFRRDFFDRYVMRMELPNFGLERSDEQIFKQGYQMMTLEQLEYTLDSLSLIIDEQQRQLRGIMKPAYDPPHLYTMKADTSLRSKIPDNYRERFDGEVKSKKQNAIKSAISEVRSQRDQIAGLSYELDDKSKRSWKYEIEWHRKFTMSLACIILFFIGAPLGAIIRKGGLGTPVIIAVIFFVLYYVVSMIGEKSAREGALTPFEGMWLATFIVLPLGVFLTYQATRDSSIFNPELYLNFLKKGLTFVFVIYREPRPVIDIETTAKDLQPGNMISELESLSNLCKAYATCHFGKGQWLNQIWEEQKDTELAEIAACYDRVRAIIHKSDIDMIRESVEEYPETKLQDYKILKTRKWQPHTAAIIFPVWLYLYVKVLIQKNILRNELRNIMSSDRNLVNELKSIF